MFTFPADVSRVKEASAQILSRLRPLSLTESMLFDVKLCFEEALINAIKYGSRHDRSLTVNVEVFTHDDRIEIAVYDHGTGFDLHGCADPTRAENIAKTGGRGVFLIKHLMDEVSYDSNGHCLRMVKKIKRGA